MFIVVFGIVMIEPSLIIILIILMFTFKVDIKKMLFSSINCIIWDEKFEDLSEKMEGFYNPETNKIKVYKENDNYKQKNNSYKPQKSKIKGTSNTSSFSTSKIQKKKKYLKHWITIGWEKQKSIWDDYESVLDKFK